MSKKRDPADALARALEGDDAAVTGEIASLVALARMLEDLPEPAIDATFAGGLEAAILGAPAAAPVAAASAPLAPVIALRRPSLRVKRALVAAIAAAMVLALPVVASASAQPGSALYGVKLRREQAALKWSCRTAGVRCGFTHMDLASERVRDLRAVVESGRSRWVRPTMKRLNRHLSAGTSQVLSARPPAKTLRKLQDRLDQTSVELQAIAGFAPPEVREALAPLIASGDDLNRRVLLALGEPLTELVPPQRFERTPPVVAEPPPASSQTDRTANRPRRQRRTPGNNYGPGGTPRIAQPRPGETWESDDPTRDDCPVAAVAAPGVGQICDLTGARSR